MQEALALTIITLNQNLLQNHTSTSEVMYLPTVKHVNFKAGLVRKVQKDLLG